jgi:hypothetical protein
VLQHISQQGIYSDARGNKGHSVLLGIRVGSRVIHLMMPTQSSSVDYSFPRGSSQTNRVTSSEEPQGLTSRALLESAYITLQAKTDEQSSHLTSLSHGLLLYLLFHPYHLPYHRA